MYTEATPLWSNGMFRVELRRLRADAPAILWIGVSATGSTVQIEALAAVVIPWFRAAADEGHRMALHVEHCESDTLAPPDAGQLFHIVGTLVDHRDLIERALLATVIQAKALDTAAVLAKDLFLGLYQPRRRFDLVEGSDAARAFLEHECRGRA